MQVHKITLIIIDHDGLGVAATFGAEVERLFGYGSAPEGR